MASHDMQGVMKVVNDFVEKELADMKKERLQSLESFKEDLRRQMESLESFKEGIRLEMTEIQKRQDDIQQRQDRQEAAIKALMEAKTSQHQAPENLEKEVATASKAVETVSEQIRGMDDQVTPAGHSQDDHEAVTGRTPGSPLPNTESRSGSVWKGTNLYILNAPEDWEPPQYCPEPPEMDELWLSRRGSKISRHPLADSLSQPGESALERATRLHGDGKDGI